MPSHSYEPLPTTDFDPPNTTYFTGLPTTAPPSFHSVALSASRPSSTLPHRNDENAATVMPQRYRNSTPQQPASQQIVDMDEVISLWAPSESNGTERERELDETRENTIVGLIGRVEELERRLENQTNKEKEERDLEAQTRERKTAREQFEYWATGIGVTVFCIFVMAVVLIAIMAAYRRAGNKQS